MRAGRANTGTSHGQSYKKPPATRAAGGAITPPVPYSSEFRCFAGCEGSWPVTRPIYRCPKCQGLLQVVHDTAALKDRSGAAWMKLFDDRYRQNVWPYGSGVWGKREWVMPQVPDEMIVSMYEGGTNLFWADRYGKEIGVDD